MTALCCAAFRVCSLPLHPIDASLCRRAFVLMCCAAHGAAVQGVPCNCPSSCHTQMHWPARLTLPGPAAPSLPSAAESQRNRRRQKALAELAALEKEK